MAKIYISKLNPHLKQRISNQTFSLSELEEVKKSVQKQLDVKMTAF